MLIQDGSGVDDLHQMIETAPGPRVSPTPLHLVTRHQPRREHTTRRLLAAADVLALVAALAVAALAIGDGLRGLGEFAWTLITIPAWILLVKLYGLYDRDHKRVSHATVDDIPHIVHALVIGGLGLWLFSKVAPVHRFTFLEGATFFGTAFLLIFVIRAAARAGGRAWIGAERVLFVGGGDETALLVRKVRAHPEYGLEPIGYVETSPDGDSGPEPGIAKLGNLSDLERLCLQHGADRVVIAAPAGGIAELPDVVRLATSLGLRISLVPHLADVLGPSVEIDDVEGVTVIGINPVALTRSSRLVKRAMDIAITGPLLLCSLPLLAIIAAAVKLSSPGAVIYSQERLGREGRRFRIHKFRTMTADADARVADLRTESLHPAWLLLDHDPRITPLGRALRRTSLDELPQLWNVLKGEMSLVGPRPMTPEISEQIPEWAHRRLDLTPGLTGLWQVLGRATIPFEEMVKLDYLYVTNWGLWQDVRLLLRTLPAVLRGHGAN